MIDMGSLEDTITEVGSGATSSDTTAATTDGAGEAAAGSLRQLDKRSIDAGNFLWSIADILRGHFRRGEYQNVILPFTVLRRLDCVLAPTKQQVIDRHNQLYGKMENLHEPLCRAAGYRFYNVSPFTFERLLNDSQGIGPNLRSYIGGFSENMREVLRKFDFEHTIARLEEAGILYLIASKFAKADLHPKTVSNAQMGSIFEYLIFKFNEALDENPGEHYTPREVVELCTELLLRPTVKASQQSGAQLPLVHTVYDPCCGTGGMLVAAYDRIKGTTDPVTGNLLRPGINPEAEVFLFGQELNPQTYAVCKSDMYMKLPDNDSAENIAFGSVLSADGHADKRFEFILSNPPYGADWRADEEAVRRENTMGEAGRFGPGVPRINDGQLLFLLHMIARLRPEREGGGRIAVIMNGSPLFSGDAGSPESEIRRHILENDLLEAIIALPGQMFYNTPLTTYVLVLSNAKAPERWGKVQLINGESFWKPMRKSQGQKRRMLDEENIREILDLHDAYGNGEQSRILSIADLGYRKIRVERPLRLSFAVTPERLAQLEADPAFTGLAQSRKKSWTERDAEAERGRATQAAVREALALLPDRKVWKDREVFAAALETAVSQVTLAAPPDALPGTVPPEPLKLSPALRKAILSALAKRDPEAEVCRDRKGNPEPDPELRVYENVPLREGVPASELVESYFAREVAPHVPKAWIDTAYRDEKDGGIGIVGYEINLRPFFTVFEPPRPLSDIDRDIREVEEEILVLLRQVTSPQAAAQEISVPRRNASGSGDGNGNEVQR